MQRRRRSPATTVARAHARAAVAFGLLLPIGALVLTGCEQKAPRGATSPDVPDQEVRQFSLTESVNGRLKWRVTAAAASSYRAQGLIQAREVTIDFFDGDGKRTSRLTADRGEIRTATNDMSASGRVRITTENGTRVETESLRYQNREQRIVSDDRVTVRQDGNVLSGTGFVSDPTLERFEFRKTVRAQVQSSSGRLRVRARGESP